MAKNLPNWADIKRCPIWKALGVIECNNCDTKAQCWGDDFALPMTMEGIGRLNKTLKEIQTEKPISGQK
jgi:hypothetical protein